MPWFNDIAGDVPFKLCLLQPNWNKSVTISHAFETFESEALTGLESRAPTRRVFRLGQTLRFLMFADEAAEFQTTLLNLSAQRLGFPIWPDDLPVADYNSNRAYAANWFVNYDKSTGEFAINADGGFPRMAGLIIGYLKSQPKITALTPEIGMVEVALGEDSPWQCRIVPNSVPMPTWNLVPDWAKEVTEVLRSKFSTEQIGHGREMAVAGQESAAKRVQQAGFSLDRTEIKELLGFFDTQVGSLKSFALPRWFRPGGTENIPSHFDNDSISITWLTPDTGQTTISFAEELATIAGTPSQERPARAFLYKIGFDGVTPRYWTDWENALPRSGNTYTPQKIQHKSFVQSTRPEGDEIELYVDNFDGNPLRAMVLLELERRLLLEIYECDPNDPEGAVEIFNGEILRASAKGRRLTGYGATVGGVMNRELPRGRMQCTCNTTLYSDVCGVTPDTFKVSGTVLVISSLQIDVNAGGDKPADYFANGWILLGTGDSAERRAIVRSTPITGGQRLTLHKPMRQGTGVTADFYPGCDGQFESGCLKFSNQDRFYGFPWMPAYLDSVATGWKMQVGK